MIYSSIGLMETPVMLNYILQRLIHLEQSLIAEKEINITLRKNLEDIQSNYFVSMVNDNFKHKLKDLTEDNTQLLAHVYKLECRLNQC